MICFAVLAHEHPAALADLIAALSLTSPGSPVVVFNGGRDATLTDGFDRCPGSRPLRHGHLAAFHDAALAWFDQQDGDWLVTLDSDVLPTRPGLDAHLAGLGADYAAGHLSLVQPGTPWRPGRRFLRDWSRWQPLLAIEHPWRCFNPVQAFSRRYALAYLDWPGRPALLDLVAASPHEALEEIVWPSVGAALGLRLAGLGGDEALRLRPPTPAELGEHLADPAVFVVHKVRTTPDASERQLIGAHLRGEPLDLAAAQRAAAAPRPESRLRALGGWAKDAQLWLRSR